MLHFKYRSPDIFRTNSLRRNEYRIKSHCRLNKCSINPTAKASIDHIVINAQPQVKHSKQATPHINSTKYRLEYFSNTNNFTIQLLQKSKTKPLPKSHHSTAIQTQPQKRMISPYQGVEPRSYKCPSLRPENTVDVNRYTSTGTIIAEFLEIMIYNVEKMSW